MNPPNTAFERNRDPILNVLKNILSPFVKQVFEIGSGTGQHGVYFAPHFPWLQWVTSEMGSQLEVVRKTLAQASFPNLRGPLEFEVGKNELPLGMDAFFSANTLHIMSEERVRILIQQLGKASASGTSAIFYGPFNYKGKYTSDSNATFDQWLKSIDPERGIRSFEDISRWMTAAGFHLAEDIEMPSNNRILHFIKGRT